MNDDERFEKLREKEINRLIESEGSETPINGILTDDEILKYAGNSITASEIRLKRGIGVQADKSNVHNDMYIGIIVGIILVSFPVGVISFVMDNLIGKIIFFSSIILMATYYIYVMYIKDYTDPQYRQINQNKDESSLKTVEEPRISTNDDLLLLFNSKEKIAREMIERRFPAPQMTNDKFNTVLDNCKNVVESQIEILNALTPTEKTKYEISSRKKLIKQLINKVDDLTNELILSEDNDIEDVIEEMDNLINSVKEYK